MGWTNVSNKLVMTTIGTSDSAVPANAKWILDTSIRGYRFKSSSGNMAITLPTTSGGNITITNHSAGASAQTLTIKPITASYHGVTIKNSVDSLVIDDSSTFTAVIYSTYNTFNGGNVTWSVSNGTGSATVNSSTGSVTGVSQGIVTVTATYKYSYSTSWTAQCSVDIIPILTGTYYLQNEASSRYLTPNTGAPINISSHIEQWNYNYDLYQAWDFIYIGNGYYRIKNIDYNTYLTSPSSNLSGEKITAEALLSSDNDRQLWYIYPQSNNTYQLRAKNRGSFVISSNSATAGNGGNVVQRSSTDGNITKWNIVHWKDTHTDVYINYGLSGKQILLTLANSTAQNSTWKPIIEASVSAWNNTGIGINITTSTIEKSKYEVYVNSVNETWYGATYADSVDSTGRLTKAHIVLNTNRLTTDTAQSTLVHEIGHLFWLRDNPSATENTIMSYNRDRTTMRIPQIFDIYNVKYRYE